MTLSGRRAIVTGASQGLGAEIVRHFLAAGASVLMCARSAGRLSQLQESLAPGLAKEQQLIAMPCDVGEEADVDRVVTRAVECFGGIDVLVNNAGVYGPMGPIDSLDWKQWVEAIRINLMGTVYPCRMVVQHMRRRGYGKIVNLSGGGATNPLPNLSSYAASKAAVVRFTETLALEVKSAAIDVNAVAPGALATKMLDEVIEAGADIVGREFHARMIKIKAEGGTPLAKGAALCVYLASAASDGITGKLLSAVWDPWANLKDHAADLDSDIYTLRRITPADRGKDWGG